MSPTCCAQGDHQQHQDDLHQHLHHRPPVPQGYSLPRYFAPSSPVTTVLLPTFPMRYQWWGWCWWCLWRLTTGEDGDCGDDDDNDVDVDGGDGDDGENWPQQREAGFSSTWTTTVCTLFWGFHGYWWILKFRFRSCSISSCHLGREFWLWEVVNLNLMLVKLNRDLKIIFFFTVLQK